MKTYKLLALRANGTIGPLFINRKQVIPTGVWLAAEDHPTKGYAHRPGWHTCADLKAPHLTMKGRIWCECEVEDDAAELKRPESQGNTWYLSQTIKITKKLWGVVHENPFGKDTTWA